MQAVLKYYIERPNDRFGFNSANVLISYLIVYFLISVKETFSFAFSIEQYLLKKYLA